MRCETYSSGAQYGGRSFLTKEEKIEKLEDYKSWLENETKGVAEHIDTLKKAS